VRSLEQTQSAGTMTALKRALSDRLGIPSWAVEHVGAAVDVALALVLFAAAMVSLASAETGVGIGTRSPDTVAYILGAVLTLPLVVRRRWPLPVLGVILVAVVMYDTRDYAGVNVDFFGPILAFYTVAAHTPRRISIAAAVAVVVAVLIGGRQAEASAGNYVAVGVIIAGVWLLGDGARSRRIYGERLAAQAEALRSARLELADQAVAQERLRIARELHDVVAHHMSAIVVQSALAQAHLEPDPPASRHAMAQVEEIGRSALREMRQILGVLRQAGEEQGALDPSPSMSDLERLYAHARDGGLTVDAVVEGAPTSLPPAIELAAYRIVQESLTNALKHAPGAHVEVRLGYGARALTVEVRDDGAAQRVPRTRTTMQGARRTPMNGGQGLVGMRERVVLLNGTFEAGPRPDGGFRVAATLPLEGAV
jgi:signal transduction histidine kinase